MYVHEPIMNQYNVYICKMVTCDGDRNMSSIVCEHICVIHGWIV